MNNRQRNERKIISLEGGGLCEKYNIFFELSPWEIFCFRLRSLHKNFFHPF